MTMLHTAARPLVQQTMRATTLSSFRSVERWTIRKALVSSSNTTDNIERDDDRLPSSSSSSSSGSSSSMNKSPSQWRKDQLDHLTRQHNNAPSEKTIHADDELQAHWRGMEQRVRRRQPRTVAETGGKSGRRNVRRSDEDVWLEQGLYDDTQE